MSEKVRVLLVDDNRQLLRSLKDFFTQKSSVVVETAENAILAIEMLKKTKIDIMILDIIMPEMDGLALLDWMANNEINNNPKVIVATALGNEDVIRTANEFGIRYFMMKPISADQLYKKILEITERRGGRQAEEKTHHTIIEDEITDLLLKMGIPANFAGYQYLREGIKMVIANREMIKKMTKQLYPSIAECFDTTPSKVERAIRHSIMVCASNKDINKIIGYQIFSKDKKPTNGEFIATVADKVLMLTNKYISK